jgi:hypothetical protein
MSHLSLWWQHSSRSNAKQLRPRTVIEEIYKRIAAATRTFASVDLQYRRRSGSALWTTRVRLYEDSRRKTPSG